VSVKTSCRTIFWLDGRTGTLSDFWTRDPRYTTPSGVHVGTPTAAAEHATHMTAEVGCGGAALRFTTPRTTSFVIYISGSHLGPKLRAMGGRATRLVLTGLPDASQVTNC
jgi:hypothetical protein